MGLYRETSEIGVWRASHSLTASSMIPCKSVPLATAASLKRAAVSRGIANVIFVVVFSSLPWGFVKKCLKFRFRTLSAEVVEKRDDAIGRRGVAFELSARKLGSDCRH